MNTPAATDRPQRPPSSRRRWPKRLAVALGGLLLTLALALGWLLGTGSGLRFVLARVATATHGHFGVQQASGHLGGRFQLESLRYHDTAQGLDVRVSSVRADVDPWSLLAGRVHLRSLEIGASQIGLPAQAKQKTTAPSPTPDLSAPIGIELDRLRVGEVNIRRGEHPVFESRSLALGGSWIGHHLRLRKLELKAPDGSAALDADLTLRAPYRGTLNGRFDWQAGGRRYAGTLSGQGEPKQLRLRLALNMPMTATLSAQIRQDAALHWTASLRVPDADAAPLLGSGSIKRLAARLDAHGDRHQATAEGDITLNDHVIGLQPLRAHLTEHDTLLILDTLDLRSSKVPGQLSMNGQLKLNATPLSGRVEAIWKQVQLPAELVGKALLSNGNLQASGSLQRFQAEGGFTLGTGARQANIQLKLDGTPERITLSTLKMAEGGGHLAVDGAIDLTPTFGWQLKAEAKNFDPSLFATSWPGRIDTQLDSHGSLAGDRVQATLDLKRLGGRLRDRPLDGHGALTLDHDVLSGDLQLVSASSRLRITGREGTRNEIRARLNIASLADWLPQAAGALNGHIDADGRWPALNMRADLVGQRLQTQGVQASRLALRADVPDIQRPAGTLHVTAHTIKTGGLAFADATLDTRGDAASHRLTLDAHGDALSLALRVDGHAAAGAWQGSLQRLALDAKGQPKWSLQAPAAMSWNKGNARLTNACIAAGEPHLCIGGGREASGAMQLHYALHRLPIALLAAIAGGNPPVQASGLLDGEGQLARAADGRLTGNATLSSPDGRLHYAGDKDKPLLSYRGLNVRAQLDGNAGRVTAKASLDQGGSLDGDVQIGGTNQSLSGHVDLHLRSLAFIELFTDQVANINGHADASLMLAGTLDAPTLTGQAHLSEFGTELPAAGLKLTNGDVRVSTADARHFDIDGTLHSGRGTLSVQGQAGLGNDAALDLKISGNAFTVADLPAADVAISPQLEVKRQEDGLHVDGAVAIDRADINLSKLPGAGAAQPSPDVVVVDAPQPETTPSPVPIHSDVQVDLGDKTHLIGFGLNGQLGGSLRIIEAPGKATSAQGQIAVNGTYRAYGQDLKIQQGRLLFASTPIDNPALDIRAVRNLQPTATIDQGQVVGLQVGGTAKRPVLSVFSSPVMAQSDALSYLITGKPLSQVKGGEGSMVGAAAQAMGSAAGDLLARSVGAKLGVDDIGVSSNEALGGTSAFTVGKYLSPRLYLSYGVGLFEPGQVVTLRFRLSHRWNIEAQNATGYSRAALNYRYEKKN